MQDYIVSLQRAASTLEQSMPLPPLGEHVTYLQNALVSRSSYRDDNFIPSLSLPNKQPFESFLSRLSVVPFFFTR